MTYELPSVKSICSIFADKILLIRITNCSREHSIFKLKQTEEYHAALKIKYYYWKYTFWYLIDDFANVKWGYE